MSNSPDDDRLEELREQKRKELEQRKQGQSPQDQEAQEAAQQQAEAQKEAMLKQHLTDGARQRLNAVQMSKPQFADKVEQQIIALARSGRIQDRIDEDQMKSLLKELQPDSQSFDIRRR
jgi:programmed cell death protein 5